MADSFAAAAAAGAEDPRWTALPPRRRQKGTKRGAAAAVEAPPGEGTATTAENRREPEKVGPGDEAERTTTAEPPTATAQEASSDSSETYASRAKRNAARVDDAVAKRRSQARARPLEASSSRSESGRYEHLDHTADVQFHAWGDDLGDALSALGNCFFDYVTERDTIDVDSKCAQSFDVDAADLDALVFRVLDELLFRFSAEGVVCATVRVDGVTRGDPDARKPWAAHVETTGEQFDLGKHPQGTEVKAITYSNMQIHEKPDRTDIFVIVDI